MLVPLCPPPPHSPHNRFLPHSKPTFWVSMGMNSQPPIPPCPAYPRLLISLWILQLAYLLYPLVTRGHERPPPHTAGKFNPPILDMAIPPPTPRFPLSNPCHAPPPLSLNGRVLVLTTSILVASPHPPPPPRYSNPAFPLLPYLHSPPPAPPNGVPYFLYSISHLLTLYPPLLPLLMLQ